MMLSIAHLSSLLNYTPQGTRKLLNRLHIPLTVHNDNQCYDTSTEHPFALSIRLQHQTPGLQILYSIRDLAKRHRKDKKTILMLLRESDVPVRGARKKYVYLWDLRMLEKQVGKK